MITTTEIRPALALAHIVRCYSWREFDTLETDLVRPWHACHELSMHFFFAALPLHLLDPVTYRVIASGSHVDIVGPGTRYNGKMVFQGRYALFEIIFRAGGFFRLFHIPSDEMTNKIHGAREVMGAPVDRLFEQLSAADGLPAKGELANAFLLGYLDQGGLRTGHDHICANPSWLLRQRGSVNVDRMASEASMSVRTFERKFLEQVGISPKLYSCVERFNLALTMRLSYPDLNWTTIAAECGYFDQMHLVKDFNRFAGGSPSDFIHHTPLSQEQYLSRVER